MLTSIPHDHLYLKVVIIFVNDFQKQLAIFIFQEWTETLSTYSRVVALHLEPLRT